MLIFCRLAGFLSYVPFILRSNVLLLIFPCMYMFCVDMHVLGDSTAFIKLTSPDIFYLTGVDTVFYGEKIGK